MRPLAILGASILCAGLLSAAAPAQAATTEPDTGTTLSIAEVLANPTVDYLDEATAGAQLMDAGFQVDTVQEDGTDIRTELDSTLGDGAAVHTNLTVDLAAADGTAVLTSADANVGSTTLDLVVHELTNEVIDVTITDPATGQTQRVTTATGSGAAVPLILGIPLIISALEALIAASAAVIIAGATYIAVTNAIEAINKGGSNYQHFNAARLAGKPLLIGNGISFSAAVSRVAAQSDVWSRSQSGASTVCKSASGGKNAIGPEIDRSGSSKVWHFHTNPRNGAHCFYGPQR